MSSTADSVKHLYLHIPFCPVKCSYCAFVTRIGSLKLLPDYLDAVGHELAGLAAARPPYPLDTVYLGGGTPSLLSPDQVAALLRRVDTLFGIAPGAEITLEAHPATVDRVRLHDFRHAGITRLSIGGESLDDRLLSRIGRTHSAAAVLSSVAAARQAGFISIALDLIYGLPGQSLSTWQQTLDLAMASGVDHLSLYPLSIESGTPFALQRTRGGLVESQDELVATMYGEACVRLSQVGMEHYEIANWARPGHRCRHNVAYWLGREYFGAGVGAHGYVRPLRTENIHQVTRYIEAARLRQPLVSRVEYLDRPALLAETIFLRLRLLEDGLDLHAIRDDSGFVPTSGWKLAVGELEAAGLVKLADNRLTLAESAGPVANEIWSRLTPSESTIDGVMSSNLSTI